MSSEVMERCDNCLRPFPESKINSHFSYCKRNIKRCNVCRQMVDVNFQEDHDKEFHTLEACQHCKLQFSPKLIGNHLANCSAKPRTCQFCEQEVPSAHYNSHTQTCGARTQSCPICNKNVLLKQYDNHMINCGKMEIPKYNEPPKSHNILSQPTPSYHPTTHLPTQPVNTRPQQPARTITAANQFGNPVNHNHIETPQTWDVRPNPPPSYNQYHHPQITHIPSGRGRTQVQPSQPPHYAQNDYNRGSQQPSTRQHVQPPKGQPNSNKLSHQQQDQMLQIAMMMSLQEKKKPQKRNEQSGQQLGFSAESLMDKSLLEDIQLQEQIMSSMPGNQRPSPQVQPRQNFNLPNRRW